jgi:protein SCO1/2
MTMRLFSIILLLSIASFGQQNHEHCGTGGDSLASSVAVQIPQTTLVDQDGTRIRFSDLVEDKVVVINTIFTNCTTICTPMAHKFAQLQKLLEQNSRSDVRLISITVDPVTDTSQRLKEWITQKKFHPGPSWTFLTGEKRDVDYVLKSLLLQPGDQQIHSPVLLIGDTASGKWNRSLTAALNDPAVIFCMIPPPREKAISIGASVLSDGR